MTQQSHSQAYTLRKPKLKQTHVSHCSLKHYLQQLEHGSNLDVHQQIKKKLWYIYTMDRRIKNIGQPDLGLMLTTRVKHLFIYSAIKRNPFESVLKRWMNLEPIIQSEVSQKEKDKYRILTHIYGIQKNGSEEFTYRQQWRNRHREQTYGHGRGEERVRCMERVTWELNYHM